MSTINAYHSFAKLPSNILEYIGSFMDGHARRRLQSACTDYLHNLPKTRFYQPDDLEDDDWEDDEDWNYADEWYNEYEWNDDDDHRDDEYGDCYVNEDGERIHNARFSS